MAIAPFHGLARKFAIPLIALSAVGWLVYVIGLGITFNGRSDSAVPQNYVFYAAAVIGPFVYSGAVGHAAFWRQISSVVGSITAVLSIAYFTAMGTVLHGSGSAIYRYYNFSNESLPSSMEIIFAGSFLACFFWAGVVAMWPWYTTGAPTRGQPQQSAVTVMNETLERGTYEHTNCQL